MKRKTAAVFTIAFFILPMLVGLGLDGYHQLFHKHQYEASVWFNAELERQMANQNATKEAGLPTVIINSGEMMLVRDLMRRFDQCWMQKYFEFAFVAAPGWMILMLFWAYFIFPMIPFRDDFGEEPEPVPV